MTNLKLDVHTADGGTNGQVELPADIFDREASIALMHQVVNAQLAAKRQGTHSTARKALAVHARAPSAHPTSPVVASRTDRSRVTTASAPPRR